LGLVVLPLVGAATPLDIVVVIAKLSMETALQQQRTSASTADAAPTAKIAWALATATAALPEAGVEARMGIAKPVVKRISVPAARAILPRPRHQARRLLIATFRLTANAEAMERRA
jgi:hypothetical protein